VRPNNLAEKEVMSSDLDDAVDATFRSVFLLLTAHQRECAAAGKQRNT